MVVVKTVDACYLKKTNAMEQPEEEGMIMDAEEVNFDECHGDQGIGSQT